MLKDKIAKVIEFRYLQLKEEDYYILNDTDELMEILTEDYDKTLEFLKNASFEEIGCVSWVLEELIVHFPYVELLNVFKCREEEFRELDLQENWNEPSIILNSFKDEVYYAEQYLKKKGVI